MLPKDLNKFKQYLNSTVTFDEENLAELLLVLQNNLTRSKYIMTIDKLNSISRPVKPHVEVHEFMTTNAEYMEKRIAITSYYATNVQKEVLEHVQKKLDEKLFTQPIVLFMKEYTPQAAAEGRCTMTGEKLEEKQESI
jgi:hypothetical protein